MINKYYLYKRILTDKALISELKEDNDFSVLFAPLTEEKLYQDRVSFIKHTMNEFIQDLGTLTGKEVLDIIHQRDNIFRSLDNNENYAMILIKNGDSFIEVLETLFEVSLDYIYAYEEAAKQLTGKRLVTIIVDGNNHNIMVNGKQAKIQTEIVDNIVTIEKCQEVTEKIKATGYNPNQLEFLLSIYTESKGNECGDFPEECLLDRKVIYYPKDNCMRVLEKGVPVYENNNGVICDDVVALTDCLM
jgi:hypothetical protein